jgi:hypothetical protein
MLGISNYLNKKRDGGASTWTFADGDVKKYLIAR